MIEEAYCSYEVSKLLNEKGFRIDKEKDYWKIGADGVMYFMCSIGAYTSDPDNKYAFYRPKDSYPCPTQQMAMRYLREVHKRVICISMGHEENKGNNNHLNPDKWYYIFEVVNEKGVYRDEEQPDPFTNEYATYEKAVEAALKYCLENLI